MASTSARAWSSVVAPAGTNPPGRGQGEAGGPWRVPITSRRSLRVVESLVRQVGRGAAARRGAAEQAELKQLLDPRQVVERGEVEVVEEGGRGDPGDRPARRLAAALGLHPAGLQQEVEG